MEDIALRILLGLVAAVCLAGGLNLLIKGAESFLPASSPTQPVLDNIFRFLSAIYFSLGFLVITVIVSFEMFHNLSYMIGIVVIFSGLGRLYSKIKIGSAGKYFDNIMIVEIILGTAIFILQYLRAH